MHHVKKPDSTVPQVEVNDKVVEDKINRQLLLYFKEFSCVNGDLPSIKIKSSYVSKVYISASYFLAGYCEGLAAPFEFSGGFTYDLVSGSKTNLSTFTNQHDLENAITKEYIKNKKEGCPKPGYGGEFYLTENNIVLKEFYPSKQYIACEF